MITIRCNGDFSGAQRLLGGFRNVALERILHKYGSLGVQALRPVTPRDTGKTADSWDYRVEKIQNGYRLVWANANYDESGTPIVILIMYGHTHGGWYIRPNDFVTPAISPVISELMEEVHREVKQQ